AVEFNHGEATQALDERLGECGQTGTDLHHGVARLRCNGINDRIDHGDVGQEMLTEALAGNVLHAAAASTVTNRLTAAGVPDFRRTRGCELREPWHPAPRWPCARAAGRVPVRAGPAGSAPPRAAPRREPGPPRHPRRSAALALRSRSRARTCSRWSRWLSAASRRSSTRIRCTPKRETTGCEISPGRSLFIGSSNSGTNWPADVQPRSPPPLAEPSWLCSRASCSKVACPLAICWRYWFKRSIAAASVS